MTTNEGPGPEAYARVRDAMQRLASGGPFREDDAHALMGAIMEGAASTEQIAALLMGLAIRGETVDEITGFARAMREHSRRIRPDVQGRLTDTCGTGGARIKTFNVSTSSAFVAAAAGVPIAKHGNRSVTSPTGSADVLEALGADLTLSPDDVAGIIGKVGIGFLFAPTFHPAMKHAIPARKALGVRTVFNILGPLTNPADAQAQVLGVFDERLVGPMAQVLANLGIKEAMVVHGVGGLDEVSTIGPTRIAHVKDGEVAHEELDVSQYGIKRASADDLGGVAAPESARLIVEILGGAKGPRADMVAANAACAILVGGKADDYESALTTAQELLAQGAALETLRAYVTATGGEMR